MKLAAVALLPKKAIYTSLAYEECESGKCYGSDSSDMTDITRPVVCIVSCQWSPLSIFTTLTFNAQDLFKR